jgi:hypothetical protein
LDLELLYRSYSLSDRRRERGPVSRFDRSHRLYRWAKNGSTADAEASSPNAVDDAARCDRARRGVHRYERTPRGTGERDVAGGPFGGRGVAMKDELDHSIDPTDRVGMSDDDPWAISLEDSTVQESLTETRRIINRQLDIAENINDESFKMIRLNLVFLGGIATVIFSARELFVSAILFVSIGMGFISVSLLLSSYTYGSMALYGGFGDSPALDFEKLSGVNMMSSYETVLGEYDQIRRELPSSDEFRAILLSDHEKGVLHNNVEIKSCWSILRHGSVLLYIGIIAIAIGVGTEFIDPSRAWRSVLRGVGGLIIVIGVTSTLKSISVVSAHMNRLRDEERFDYDYYGHDFFQDAPLFLAKYYLVLYNWLFSRSDDEDGDDGDEGDDEADPDGRGNGDRA